MPMEFLNNSKILVAGGAGFVGSNLIKLILRESSPASIVVVDNLLSAEKENLPADKRISFIEGSIASDPILATLRNDINYIFHLATYHGNQSSIHDPVADHENNTLTTLKLFNTVRSFSNLRKVVYSAAGCAVAAKDVADNAAATAEDAPISIDMDSPYSISKIIGEFYAVYYFKQHGLPTVRARFQNVYGPGEILGAGKWRGTPATVWRNVTPTFIFKSLAKEALPLENEGASSRDFIFVEDICRGLLACAEKGRPGDVYNIASSKETTIRELAEMINKITGNPTPCEIKPRRDWDHSIKRFGSGDKAERELGFKAVVPLEEGLIKTVDWTKANHELIKKIMMKHAVKMPELKSYC